MTKSSRSYGSLTAEAVGVLLKEMVRRAIEAIQAQQFTFEAERKTTSYSSLDVVTSADRAAQEIYLKLIRECLPSVGIIAEEDELRIPPSGGCDMYVTVDPLDGTRAFTRRQSHGVGTMIALIEEREVLSAYVGDVMTKEIFGFRPESAKVHRISQYNIGTHLEPPRETPLGLRYLLMRDEPAEFSDVAQKLFFHPDDRLFRSFEITSGSVGIQFSRLWKDEVGGILFRSGAVTPWDHNPVYGITHRMGYVFLEIHADRLVEAKLGAIRDFTPIDHEVLVVHESRLDDLRAVVPVTRR